MVSFEPNPILLKDATLEQIVQAISVQIETKDLSYPEEEVLWSTPQPYQRVVTEQRPSRTARRSIEEHQDSNLTYKLRMEPPKLSDLPSPRSPHPPHLRAPPGPSSPKPIQNSPKMVGLAQNHVRVSCVVEDLYGRVEPLGERPPTLQDARFVLGLGLG